MTVADIYFQLYQRTKRILWRGLIWPGYVRTSTYWKRMVDRVAFLLRRSTRKRVSASEWRDKVQRAELQTWLSAQVREGNFAFFEHTTLRKLRLNPDSLQGSIIVDIGSGPKSVGCFLNNSTITVAVEPLAVEYSENGILQRAGDVAYLSACGENVPLRNQCADAVFILNALDHAIDPLLLLHEAGRLLKSNGRLFIFLELNNCFRSRKTDYADCHPYDFSEVFILTALQNLRFHEAWHEVEGDRLFGCFVLDVETDLLKTIFW